MKSPIFFTFCFTFFSLLLIGQQTEFEKMKAEEERYRQAQQAAEKQYGDKVQEGLDSIALEYIKYEMEREKQILEFEGKNLDPRLVELARQAERRNALNKTFINDTKPGTLLGKLKEEVSLAPHIDKEIEQTNKPKGEKPKEKKPEKEDEQKEETPIAKEEEIAQLNKPTEEVEEAEELEEEAPSSDPSVDPIIQQEIAANRPIFVPLKKDDYRISSHFNKNRMHPVLNTPRPHNGIDLAAPKGKPIYASAAGIIELAQYSKSAGNWIMLNHQNGYKTHYFHLNKLKVKAGSKVKAGDIIGYVGSTGYSSGPHLHYEVRKDNIPIDPHPYLMQHF